MTERRESWVHNPRIADQGRVPELLLAIKAEVDRERRPGRFLLTGSTRLLGAPKLADSLAGRMEALTALARSGRRRTAWFDSYVSGVIDREVRALVDASYLRELPRLLRLCAARSSGELNVTDLARDLGLTRSTTDSYLAHLEAVFLIQTVPAWSTNLTARVVRRPKLTITDSGLAARLLGGRLGTDPQLAGRLVETFVVGELRAQAEWSEVRPNLFHFRDRDGAEVDLVLESGDGRVVGIEVKAGATVRAEDLRGLRLL